MLPKFSSRHKCFMRWHILHINMVDKLEEEKRRNLQRNEGGNEDPTADIPSQEVKQQGQEEDDYYEEGNGGATD